MFLGERIKTLRQQRGLLQRQLASSLEIDTPMLSKFERGERSAKREQVFVLAKILLVAPEDLLTLWLADKVYDMIKNEELALKALSVTEAQVKKMGKKFKK